MSSPYYQKLRYYLRWLFWVLLVQIVLINVSASIYAYKFTHFYNAPSPPVAAQNIFNKTWKLFTGPTFYKNTHEPYPPFPVENITLKTSDEINIDAWYSQLDTATTCVIFFHGISVNKSYLVKEASMFRSWGYNIFLIDFRAHGKSGGNNTSFGIHETSEVQEAVAWARSKGNRRIILYGVSLGAGICIRAAGKHLVQPDAIIADMPFGSLRNHLRARAHILGFPSEPFATLVTFWIGVERGYNGFSHNIATYAKTVECPVLVEWGERDQYVKRSEVEEVFQSLPAGKKMVVYPAADHESFLQVDPVTWQQEVKSFLASVP